MLDAWLAVQDANGKVCGFHPSSSA
jgi:hypothetical protein